MAYGATVTINEELLNRQIKPFIEELSRGYLTDYKFIFVGEGIIFEGKVNMPKIGEVNASYMVRITDFVFNENIRFIELSYMEDLRGVDPITVAAIAFAKKKGSVLATAVSKLGKTYITELDGRIRINLSEVEKVKKIPNNIEAHYISCDAGSISFGVNFK